MNKQNNNEFPVSGRTGYPVSRFPSSRTSCRPNIRQNQFPLEPNTSYCWAFPTQRFTEYSFKLDIWSKIITQNWIPTSQHNIYYCEHILFWPYMPPKKIIYSTKSDLIYNSLNCIFFIVFFKHNLVKLPKSPFRGPLSINWSQSSPAYTVYHNPSGDTVPFILHYMYNVYCIIPICFCSPCLEAMGLPL